MRFDSTAIWTSVEPVSPSFLRYSEMSWDFDSVVNAMTREKATRSGQRSTGSPSETMEAGRSLPLNRPSRVTWTAHGGGGTLPGQVGPHEVAQPVEDDGPAPVGVHRLELAGVVAGVRLAHAVGVGTLRRLAAGLCIAVGALMLWRNL